MEEFEGGFAVQLEGHREVEREGFKEFTNAGSVTTF